MKKLGFDPKSISVLEKDPVVSSMGAGKNGDRLRYLAKKAGVWGTDKIEQWALHMAASGWGACGDSRVKTRVFTSNDAPAPNDDDPRDKVAFWNWIQTAPRCSDNGETNAWRYGLSCPVLTARSLARADSRLSVPPGTVLRVLTGETDLSIVRKRMRVARCGIRAAQRLKDSRKRQYKRQCSTVFAGERKDIAATVARLERQLESDVLALYKSKYRAERRANAEALERDRNRRKTKRRRDLDPASNYENARACRQWVWSVLQDFNYSCAYCGMTRAESKLKGFDLQIDHLFPLGHPMCIVGPRNAVPACISCNSSKGNRDPIEWMNKRGINPSAKLQAKIDGLLPRIVTVPTQETIWPESQAAADA
jgi:5-methylcytosine-specific restriction endonuclease McrA